MKILQQGPLGKPTQYPTQFNLELLFPISRSTKRLEIGLSELPFSGADIWNAYELSWLDLKGKPQVAVAEILVPYDSVNIVESKSLKLYLNSFNQTKFVDWKTVQITIEKNLTETVKGKVLVRLILPAEFKEKNFQEFAGVSLDDLSIETDIYQVTPEFLATEEGEANETLFSHLLRSNCLITNQPDWGSLLIRYQGKKINHEGLLKYIISFREHNEFHEQCVERIFVDILHRCSPEKLTVYARYTRRGGLDINPFRSNFENIPDNARSWRQ